MTLIAYSLSHKTAPLSTREKLVFSPEQSAVALKQLINAGAANEAMMLFTCNRTEVYAHSNDRQNFEHWLNQLIGNYVPLTPDNWCLYLDHDAVRHAMSVASGLEAMVLGESQVLAQMRAAVSLAQQQGTLGRQLHKLFQTVFMVAKQIRSQTGIGTNPVSMAYAAVKLAKKIFANLSKATVLLIGAGQNVELVAMHLINSGVKRIIVANRSFENAQQLAHKFQAHAIAMEDIPVYLHEADIVISSTASPMPILGKSVIERTLKIRKHRPMFMVDLAVPRDIDPSIAVLEDVYLYNIDDLQHVIDNNMSARAEAARQAQDIIDIQVQYFMREMQGLNAVDMICNYRDKITQMRDEEITKALATLRKGESAEIALIQLAQGLVNKVMHEPTTQLRQAALDGQWELLMLARKLFGL
jgi:glutamyl-tRNA reductase